MSKCTTSDYEQVVALKTKRNKVSVKQVRKPKLASIRIILVTFFRQRWKIWRQKSFWNINKSLPMKNFNGQKRFYTMRRTRKGISNRFDTFTANQCMFDRFCVIRFSSCACAWECFVFLFLIWHFFLFVCKSSQLLVTFKKQMKKVSE